LDVSRYRGIIYAVLGVLFMALLVYNNHAGLIARQNETCDAVNEVQAALVTYVDQQISRSAKSLPTIDYYKRHPVELGRALSNLERQRQATHQAFAPTSC